MLVVYKSGSTLNRLYPEQLVRRAHEIERLNQLTPANSCESMDPSSNLWYIMMFKHGHGGRVPGIGKGRDLFAVVGDLGIPKLYSIHELMNLGECDYHRVDAASDLQTLPSTTAAATPQHVDRISVCSPAQPQR